MTTTRPNSRLRRRPQLEALEDRTAPAVLTVNSLADNVTAGDGLVTLREAIIAANTDATTDLGQTGSGADTIQFDSSLFSGGAQTLLMSLGQFRISSNLSITGPGASLLTIDAQQGSRIFDIATAASLPVAATVSLEGMTLTNGRTTEASTAGYGGAVRSLVSAAGGLTVRDSTITNSKTEGANANGGGIAAFNNITIDNCVISGNSTTGSSATGGGGGGIALQPAPTAIRTITDSTIADNATTGAGGGVLVLGNGSLSLAGCTVSGNQAALGGGGISARGALTVQGSSIVGNFTTAASASGGGILIDSVSADPTRENLTVLDSTISGNYTLGDSASGGGIFAVGFTGTQDGGQPNVVRIENSVISGNSTSGTGSVGAGLAGQGTHLTMRNTTVSGNSATGSGSAGGGLYAEWVTGNKLSFDPALTLSNNTITGNQAASVGGAYLNFDVQAVSSNIIAGNSDTSGSNPDLAISQPGVVASSQSLTYDHNLIGNNTGTTLAASTGSTPDADGNFIGSGASPINPLLAPLDDYGGPTKSHALLPGSLAIDHGSGSDPDQRGVAVQNGTRDIGAFESKGFTLAYVSGSGQSANVNAAFAAPLVVQVTSNEVGVPVAGGVVTYAGPASGAGIAPNPSTAAIAANGEASLAATANGTAGGYTVTASAAGASGTAEFALTNTQPFGVSLRPGGHLVIVGTDSSDLVFVTRRDSTIRVDVWFGGSDDGGHDEDCHENDSRFQHYSFAAAGVTSVSIDVKGGNDLVVVGCQVGVQVSTDGGAGNDLILDAGSGDNTINDSGGNNVILAVGGGDHTITTGGGNDWIVSDGGDDVIDAGDGNNYVHAGSGHDVVTAGSGADIVKAGGGNDFVFAGGGNDLVDGGDGSDVLVGGDGDDLLLGGDGRDLVIAGKGADRISGNAADDLLIAGYTYYDADKAALTAIMAEWTSAGSYATRVSNLTNGTGGLTGTGLRLKGDDGANQTVFNDGSVDLLAGNQGSDWFLANRSSDNGGPLDVVSDKAASELWSDTDF